MKFIKFPNIGQYRNAIKTIRDITQFCGFNENGDPIIDKFAKMPILEFEGTIKLHGTNAGVVIANNEIWTQSRNNIITPEKDNIGFSMFIHPNKKFFIDAIDAIKKTRDINNKYAMFYGEWCGKGIQKNVAISKLTKMFVIFEISLMDQEENKEILTEKEVKNILVNSPKDIYSVYEFSKYNMKIDFSDPKKYQNDLNEITDEVESECPVGKYFGESGIGEGVVWKCISDEYINQGIKFKVKGSKHSKSKVKTLAKVDVERINNIGKLAVKLASNERLDQIHQEVFDVLNGGKTNIRKMGDFIKAVIKDIFKEENDSISESGFTGKELSKPVSKICVNYINNKLEEEM